MHLSSNLYWQRQKFDNAVYLSGMNHEPLWNEPYFGNIVRMKDHNSEKESSLILAPITLWRACTYWSIKAKRCYLNYILIEVDVEFAVDDKSEKGAFSSAISILFKKPGFGCSTFVR